MLRTTLGRLLIDQALPAELRRPDRVLDKKGIGELLQEVAERFPDRYREIAKALSDIGRDTATATGGYSFGLQHLRTTLAAKKVRMEIQDKLRKLYAQPGLSPAKRNEEIIKITGSYQKKLLDDVYDEALRENNPLALQVMSGARGNKFNLNTLIGAPLLYVDHRNEVIPVPILHNYSEGLSPAEYFASAFGARKGMVDLKSATADAGYFGKQLNQVNHRLLVSALDADDDYDEAHPRGMPVGTDDPGSAGALLAHPVAGMGRNTILTPRILKQLRDAGIKNILVRSPTVGGPADGGVYARDVGVREKGQIAPIGDYVGAAAAQAIANPITQGQISSKHSGGIAGASAGAIGGFPAINQLAQIPKTFKDGAAHAQKDGTIDRIYDAPQGGKYVVIGDEEHYVRHGAELAVKPGDRVEAGDPLSSGQWHPAEIVRHKGIGEGRRVFTKLMRDVLANSDINAERRNVELLARGLINHVRLTEEMGEYVPNDVLPYQTLEANWQPREGHTVLDPKRAVGQYLERPVLHYTIGTPIRPSVVKTLQEHKVPAIAVHRQPPPFEPEMIRAMDSVGYDPDWQTQLLGSYQKTNLLESAQRGATSDELGTSFVPALARRENFGRVGLTKGWNPQDLAKG